MSQNHSTSGDAGGTQAESHTEAEAYPRPFGERYILLKELGKGGMGQVFMAVAGAKDVERVCALKIIRTTDALGRSPAELGRRFLDEAKVVTKLSQENLVYVFDFGLTDNPDDAEGAHGYLAMEYLRGKTLTELWNRCAIKQVGFTLGISLFLISEIAAGLAYAHELPGLRLVHRDISPSNVMLSYTGGVKLIDFGLAKWTSKASQTQSGVNWGKLSYMSPEQYLGRDIDHRSDIYSLGILLWEFLTGRQLFPNEAARKSALSIAPPSQFNKAISKELDRVVLKALAGDPAERFQSASGLGQSLLRHMPKDAGKIELSQFLVRLFESDAASEAEEEQRLLGRAGELRAALDDSSRKRKRTHEVPAADNDPLIGSVLAERYFVRRKIGEGSMGRVYEGHHTGVGKRVAIKVPTHGERRKETLVQRFRLEANAASQIGHPNIADVTDCGTTASGDFFFVMEFVDGVDLGKLIRRDGALPLERTLLIAIQICRGLEAAHKAGIIHRDLKPSNVMLLRERDDGELVKVLDFGVAKFLRSPPAQGAELTMADAAIGTPRYMAPEQIDAGRTVDFRVDIYALGGVLYSMLSGGRAPYESDSIQELWRRKLNEEPGPIGKWRSELPARLSAIIMRCLARTPDARPASMTVLKAELLGVLEEIRQAGSSVANMQVPSETSMVEAPAPGRSSNRLRARLGTRYLPATLALSGAGLLGLIIAWVVVKPTPPVLDGAPRPMSAAVVAPAPTPAPVPAAPAINNPVVNPAPIAAVPVQAPTAVPPLPPVQARAKPVPAPAVASAKATAPIAALAPAKTTPQVAASPTPAADANAVAELLAQTERWFRLGDLGRAEAAAKQAIARKPTVDAYLYLGKISLNRNDPSAATSAYQSALRLDPQNARAADGLAKSKEELGK